MAFLIQTPQARDDSDELSAESFGGWRRGEVVQWRIGGVVQWY